MAEQDWLTPATAPAPSLYQNVMEASTAAPPAYDLRPLTVGEILDRTFSLFRANFLLFAGIATIAALVELIAGGIAEVILYRVTRNAVSLSTGRILISSIASLLYFFVYCVTQAATCYAVSEVYLGRFTTIASSLRAVRARWGAWIGIALWQGWSFLWLPAALAVPFFVLVTLRLFFTGFSGAAAGILFFLLFTAAFVVGVIFYIRNSLAIPAKVVEGIKVRSAMRRSKELARDAKGRIFVLLLIVWALSMVAAMASIPLSLVISMAPLQTHIVANISLLLIRFATRVIVAPVLSIGLCLIYFDRRVRTEAFDLEILLGPPEPASDPIEPSAETPSSYAPLA